MLEEPLEPVLAVVSVAFAGSRSARVVVAAPVLASESDSAASALESTSDSADESAAALVLIACAAAVFGSTTSSALSAADAVGTAASTGCGDVDGACACEFDPACEDRHCIPADEGPPVECPGITDEAACLAAGCSEFTTVAPWTIVDGACVQGPSEPLCMWFPGDAWGGTATPGSFYEKATGEAVRFGTDWIDPPNGWGDCGDPEAPPACECVGTCALAQKEGDGFLANDLPCESASDCVLADAVCYAGNTCGSVAVNQASAEDWGNIEANLAELGCCAGADPCGASVACEDQRCVVQFP